jgi:membrane dipeptidase
MIDPYELHASSILIDAHADTPQRFVDEAWDFTTPLGAGHLNLDAARRGNLAAEFFAIWVEPHEWRGRYAQRTRQLIAGVMGQIEKHPREMVLGTTPADILRAHTEGRFCVLLGLEGGHAIENSLDTLREFHSLGVRYMTLTWANSNEWADSSGDLDDPSVPHHNGLTAFGRDVVREMNRLGMMVDISHVSDQTFWDVLQTSHAPVIASHSAARALTHSHRNLSDEQLRAIATSNGVVMVPFYAAFVDEAWRTAWRATDAQREPLYTAAAASFRDRGQPVPYAIDLAVDRDFVAAHMQHVPPPQFNALIDHFDHIAQIAGIDHVGIGSDFDGFSILPQNLTSAADLPRITAALMERGYTAEQMKKILGGNLLRVFADVQAEAATE